MPNLVTWNLQGSNASTEVKWQTGVLNLMTRLPASIACLQSWFCVHPPAGPVWRPAIGVRLADQWYGCLHAISPGGADAPGLLVAAAAAANPQPWTVAGDFNREPLPSIPVGNACPPLGNTYPTRAPDRRYDYLYRSAAACQGTVVQTLLMSDHLAVAYAL